jgi:uncharacterized membrane protein (UPF0127 family)
MARKGSFSSTSGRIRGNHQAHKGRTMIYLVLLVAVIIMMIILGKLFKNPAGERNFLNAKPDINFSKEGELELLNSMDSLITSIDIEIADDYIQTQKGLMYRRSMKEMQGMLFIFPEMEMRSFWMKNTYLPLDLIYLDDQKIIVHIHENAKPRSRASLPSLKPAKYVLEVNAGFSARHYLKPGDKISFVRTY